MAGRVQCGFAQVWGLPRELRGRRGGDVGPLEGETRRDDDDGEDKEPMNDFLLRLLPRRQMVLFRSIASCIFPLVFLATERSAVSSWYSSSHVEIR